MVMTLTSSLVTKRTDSQIIVSLSLTDLETVFGMFSSLSSGYGSSGRTELMPSLLASSFSEGAWGVK